MYTRATNEAERHDLLSQSMVHRVAAHADAEGWQAFTAALQA